MKSILSGSVLFDKPLVVNYTAKNAFAATVNNDECQAAIAAIDPAIIGVAPGVVRITERATKSRAGVLHYNIKLVNHEPVVTVNESVLGKVAKNTFVDDTLSISFSIPAKIMENDPLEAARRMERLTKLLDFVEWRFREGGLETISSITND